jgi:hypothetical protein
MKIVLSPILSKQKLKSSLNKKSKLMKDIAIHLQDQPGALAEMGETLGAAGVSLEGGGVFVHNGKGIAHFLIEDAEKAKQVLQAKGIEVAGVNDVLIQKLKQDMPGQLGKICRLMATNNINILVQYSDHSNQLILVVDDHEKGKIISANWAKDIYE